MGDPITPATLQRMLADLRFSEALPNDVLEQLADEVTLQEFARGERVFREGASSPFLYLVVEGHFSLAMNVPGRGSVPILTVGKGEMFGWSALLGEGQMTTGAVATEDATCLVAKAAKLGELCESNHTLGFHLMRRMAHALSARLVATRLQLLDVFSDHI